MFARSIAGKVDPRLATRPDRGHDCFNTTFFLLMLQDYWRTIKYQFQSLFWYSLDSTHDKSWFLKFKQWKRPFCLCMESILLRHIYHTINNNFIPDYTVNNNHTSLDSNSQKETFIKQCILMKYTNITVVYRIGIEKIRSSVTYCNFAMKPHISLHNVYRWWYRNKCTTLAINCIIA